MNREGQLIISATTSARRNLALEQLPNIELMAHPGPKDELENDDTTLVAAAKATYLIELISNSIKNPETSFIAGAALTEIIRLIDQYEGHFKVISADVRTETKERAGDLEPEKFVSHGKPQDIDEFQRTIFNMSKTREKIYQVFAGSQILQYHPQNELPIETKHAQKMRIKLRPSAIQRLNTDIGVEEYINQFREFYSSSAYSKNGLPSIDFTDISAGLSLPVLIQGGYVDSLGLDNQEFKLNEVPRKLLKQIIYGVAVGYSPHVLEKIYPGAYEFIIDNWDWLEGVVDHVKK